MINLLLVIGFIFSVFLLIFPIKKIISQNKIDNDLLFILLSNLILLLGFLYFFIILNHLFTSFFISLFLMIFAYLLIYHIKNILGKYEIFSLFYFLTSVYNFSSILILTLF